MRKLKKSELKRVYGGNGSSDGDAGDIVTGATDQNEAFSAVSDDAQSDTAGD